MTLLYVAQAGLGLIFVSASCVLGLQVYDIMFRLRFDAERSVFTVPKGTL